MKRWGTRKRFENFLISLQTMLEGGVSLTEALAALRNIKSMSEFARKGLRAVESGEPFAAGLRSYLSPVEMSILVAGERANNLVYAVDRLLYLREASSEAKGMVLRAVVYPIFLLLMGVGVVMFAGRHLAPAYVEMGVSLDGKIFGLYVSLARLEVIVPLVLIVSGTILGLVLFSVKALGEYRMKTDRFFPFSVYRFWVGVVFLYVFSILLKSGYSETQALEEIGKTNPYFRWLTRLYMMGRATNVNLGLVMLNTFPVPDEEAGYLLSAVSTQAGYHEKLPGVAERYIKRFMSRLEVASKILNIAMLMLVGMLVIGYVLGTYQINAEIMKSLQGGLKGL